MHKFLRSVGFSNLKSRAELKELLTDVIQQAKERSYVTYEENSMYAEFSMSYGENIGLTVRGEFDEENNFTFDYFFPYLRGTGITTEEDVSIERHAATESYAGICDDLKIGVSLIFYLQNMIDYLKLKNQDKIPFKGSTITVSGLSCQGTIMMPIQKNDYQKKILKNNYKNRSTLIQAARKGDEDAIESLTLEDMDTYSTISRKIMKEDVFSLVDTYFMPYGVECDQYSVLGEIVDCHSVINQLTKDKLFVMTLSCNDLLFDVCINEKDLLGEPHVGRRFKGTIWLQGQINFPE